jgi:polyisoprenyl-teichoic acid--peptidoglycan teichoic acid transferase
MDDERPPSLARSMWLRFVLAAVLIMSLSGVATATVVLNEATGLAQKIFPEKNRIKTPGGLVTEPYGGGPQTFLVLGSDRRSGSKNSLERTAAPRSDTMLLVRFDPSQGQTSVVSIPRDLMVNIRTPSGQLYPDSKINAAYTIGGTGHGDDGGSVLAAETIEREVFPELKGQLNGIIDVNFEGFIKVVDALGCAYVNVDHRYLGGGALGEDFSAINLQPGYQKLCYNNALSYVRFRHYDSDLVRVARQQDFLRSLREQVSPELGSIDRIAKAVGHAIRTNFHASASKLIELSKLIAFSQSKPLRQVKFRYSSANFTGPSGESFVTSTPELEKETLADFLHGTEKVHLPASHPSSPSKSHHHHSSSSSISAAAAAAKLDLVPTTGENEMVTASLHIPFAGVLYPTLQTAAARQLEVHPYALRNFQKQLHFAYVVVWQTNMIGGYYDFEGTDWLHPPLFNHSHTSTIGGRDFKLVNDGAHIHVIGWKSGKALYWLTNTLLEELSNSQMIAIAKSAQTLH